MKNHEHILKEVRRSMFLPWRTVGLLMVALALILALTEAPPAQAEGFKVDRLVTFTPLTSTYRTLSDTTGCPAGCSGKFTFTARLTNKSTSPAMPGITVRVLTLTNGNVLLDSQNNVILGGVGAVMQVPKVGQYTDGMLSSGEMVKVPFVLCLKTRQPFQFLVEVAGVVTQLVSINRAGTNSSETSVGGYRISANGRFVAFDSCSSDVVANDTNQTRDVFIRDLNTGTITLVSVNRLGTNSGNDNSYIEALSADGRFVAFASSANDLVANDTNGGLTEVFVRDLKNGTTTLASVNRDGMGGRNGPSYSASLSADGRFVAFTSGANDLVATDTNGTSDLFVRDLQMGTTALVSVNQAGMDSGNGDSQPPVFISADGRFVVFRSLASDLVATDTNGTGDVFVRDLQMGTTALVSVNQAGMDSGNGDSFPGTISTNGRFVAFSSAAGDLVSTDTNGADDVFVRDLQARTTTLVSVNLVGTNSGNGASWFPSLSADGRFVSFQSGASDLVAKDPPFRGIADVFVRDLQNGTTTLVSVNRTGTNTGGSFLWPGGRPSISANGRFVAFSSQANDLVATDTNGGQPTPDSQIDVFVRDLQTGTTTLVSVNRTGTDSGNHSSAYAEISADGRFVVFPSLASNLVATDTNGTWDLFVRPVQ